MKLEAKIPSGPLEKKWASYRFEMKLVNPANKRKFEVIVIGSGLAAGSAAATLAEPSVAKLSNSLYQQRRHFARPTSRTRRRKLRVREESTPLSSTTTK